MKIYTFDTTLRDGTQGESVSFSVDDKLLIAQKLDELGIDYIEGGWPGSNPKDKQFFERAVGPETHAREADGFRFHPLRAKSGRQRSAMFEHWSHAGTPVISIFGKSWDLHTRRALGITEEENLALIGETVAFLKQHGKEVVYDAEHFFDGYASNPDLHCGHWKPRKKPAPMCSACATPTAARCRPRLAEVVAACAQARFDGVIGIHAHNDSDMAVANTLAGGRSRRDACAGLHERLRRALRQREHRQRYRQSRTEAGARHRSAAIDSPELTGVAASSRSWPICRCGTISHSSARALSPTKAAFTSAR